LANSNCGVRDALNIAVVVLVEGEAGLALGALSRDVLAASTVERAHLARILICHEIALDALIAVRSPKRTVHAPWDIAGNARGLACEGGTETFGL
jgi:hypothetical protein